MSGSSPSPSWFVPRRLLLVAGLALTGISAAAADRNISISAPATAVAGSKVEVTITAHTDAGGGEQIGFFHADYSTNGGATWTGITGALNEGLNAKHTANFKVGAAGSVTMVRVRVAFRGGRAGDVDFNGNRIAWHTSWANWQEPPAKSARIVVVAR